MPSLPWREQPGSRVLVRTGCLVAALIAGVSITLLPGLSPDAQASPQVSDVDRRIRAASQRLGSLVERYNVSRADLTATQVRVNATTSRLAELDQAAAAARHRIRKVVVWAYQTSPASEAGAVLGAGSPTDLIRRLTTIEAMARVQGDEIDTVSELARRATAQRNALQQLAAQQQRQQAALAVLTHQVEQDLVELRRLRARLAATSRSVTPARTTAIPPRLGGWSGRLARVLAYAYAQIGRPYQYGAAGPGSFDCSGLAMSAWRAGGVDLPHSAARQYRAVRHISRGDLRPADLVFYYSDIHHVAVYVGRGWVIHAPEPGQSVRLAPIDVAPVHGYGRP